MAEQHTPTLFSDPPPIEAPGAAYRKVIDACETALAIAEDRQGGTWDDVMGSMRGALAAAPVLYRAVNAHAGLVAACEKAEETLHRLAIRLGNAGAYGLPEDMSGHYNGTGIDGETVQTFQALRAALAAARGRERP